MSRNFIDPGYAVAVTIAMAAAMRSKRKSRIVTGAEIASAQVEAEREDWNRAVEARKATKRASAHPSATARNEIPPTITGEGQ